MNDSLYKIQLRDYLKRHGYAGSNTEAKRLIRSNKVLVNGIVAKSCSIRVPNKPTAGAQVVLVVNRDGNDHDFDVDVDAVRDCEKSSFPNNKKNYSSQGPPQFCLVYHKPCGMICSLAREENGISSDLTLGDIDPPLPHGFHPVGRLDQHSHGLLLFSSDGRLTSALLSSSSTSCVNGCATNTGAVERVYEIVVRRCRNDSSDMDHTDQCNDNHWHESIRRKVQDGVSTDYGFFKGTIHSIRDNAPRDYEHSFCGTGCGGERNDVFGKHGIHNILVGEESFSGDNENNDKRANGYQNDSTYNLSSITVTVREGKKRMVRRLFAALGLFVVGECVCSSSSICSSIYREFKHDKLL